MMWYTFIYLFIYLDNCNTSFQTAKLLAQHFKHVQSWS